MPRVMRIHVNGEDRTVEPACSVERLLELLQLPGPCAVEVNARVVPKTRHAAHRLADGDTVEIVTFVGGG